MASSRPFNVWLPVEDFWRVIKYAQSQGKKPTAWAKEVLLAAIPEGVVDAPEKPQVPMDKVEDAIRTYLRERNGAGLDDVLEMTHRQFGLTMVATGAILRDMPDIKTVGVGDDERLMLA